MGFNNERDFEDALVGLLSSKYGWDEKVLNYPTEEELYSNWADILFNNNKDIDRLNGCPLTVGEMRQIKTMVEGRSPLFLNRFVNGKELQIKRDNPSDKLHFGKEISLKIYDRNEIAGGRSRYQIARQPKFAFRGIYPERRGDVCLLINGMPLIHIELKRSGVSVSAACNQIEKYSREGAFTGIFSLVQIFVAMNPEETLYFANPGCGAKFNHAFYFHWADFNNTAVNLWNEIARVFLSIPMAHQMIGFYTVADDSDGVLKVMRSYQYYAANAISEKMKTMKWDGSSGRGGYVWHTTGSGKTMTSFKSAQLMAESGNADKVLFLMDRNELWTQSAQAYRDFADSKDDVQDTDNTCDLVEKMKDRSPQSTLIVTSIQKMNILGKNYPAEAEAINSVSKRIAFIVDECHRSTFGDSFYCIKNAFPNAVFFGFSGTPIMSMNKKKGSETSDVFGNELHRYSIADGIRDGNVLGFDPYKVCTYEDSKLKEVVALEKAKASSIAEAVSDPKKKKVFYRYYHLPMAGGKDKDGKYVKGVEDYVKSSQYETHKHRTAVVKNIREYWTALSVNGKFHAIFATSSIGEAIEYYRLLKSDAPEIKVCAVFDPNTDGPFPDKTEAVAEIVKDYNARYGTGFGMSSLPWMKKDVSCRLAHKKPYELVERTPEKEIDLLIVVEQMLTGFDSKWVNTLYLDKVLEYERIIQAFSRTNRIFSGEEKPFGIVKYYRKPHTMERNIRSAVEAYSGNKSFGIFVAKLDENLREMDRIYGEIARLFESAGVGDFAELPKDAADCGKFAKLFKLFVCRLGAAKVQDFCWDNPEYKIPGKNGESLAVKLKIDKRIYEILLLRYKELSRGGGGGDESEPPYDIDTRITQMESDDIDSEFINSKFRKYLKNIEYDGLGSESVRLAEEELHKCFPSLSRDDQECASSFLSDIRFGKVRAKSGKTFKEYLEDYKDKRNKKRIGDLARRLGLDEKKLADMVKYPEKRTADGYEDLETGADFEKARIFFEKKEGKKLSTFDVNMKLSNYLRKFVESGGSYDIPSA